MKTIDLRGVENLAEVLVALYNASRPLGLGFLHYTPGDMELDEASRIMKRYEGKDTAGGISSHFDYLKGRIMKVCIGKSMPMRVDLYDRDNGSGAAAQALSSVRGWKWHDGYDFG